MCEPTDDWLCESGRRSAMIGVGTNMSSHQSIHELGSPEASGNGENDFTFLREPVTPEDDDEVTESKIRAFLDEKVPMFPLLSFSFPCTFVFSYSICFYHYIEEASLFFPIFLLDKENV